MSWVYFSMGAGTMFIAGFLSDAPSGGSVWSMIMNW
jgi:hypothetical protein